MSHDSHELIASLVTCKVNRRNISIMAKGLCLTHYIRVCTDVLAQWIERLPYNRKVVSSIPGRVNQKLERFYFWREALNNTVDILNNH